ncbi:MAG: hypothetical protein ACW98D_10010 [Promethearchaeota archaeon]|jgi:hypothetical protein
MDDKETYVSGLIVSQTGEDYNLRYHYRQFPNPIKLEDFRYIIHGNKKAKINNQVETFFTTIDSDTDMEECRKEIKAQLRNLFPTSIGENHEEHKKNVIEPDLSVDSWEVFKERLESCIDGRNEDYKFVLTVITSYWFIEDDADFGIYIILLAPKGKGKSALLSSFKDSEFVVCLDNLTLESWAPGNPDPSSKIKGVADIVQNHTLLMHDTTSLFGNDEKKIKKILSDFEQSFGKEPYKKGMPGKIQEFGGGWNGVFGMPPQIFKSNRLNFLKTSRFLVRELSPIDEREILLEGKAQPDKKEIQKICCGFLKNLHKKVKTVELEIPVEVKHYIVGFLEVYVNWLNVYKKQGEQLKYHEYESEGYIRRYNQILTLIKANLFIEGRDTATIEDAKQFLEMLWFAEDNEVTIQKLRKIPDFKEQWLEFVS